MGAYKCLKLAKLEYYCSHDLLCHGQLARPNLGLLASIRVRVRDIIRYIA